MTTEERRAYAKAWREANQEKIKAYREAHKEQLKEYQKEHPEEAREAMRRYYQGHLEERRAYSRMRSKTPHGKWSVYRSSAKKRGLIFALTREQFESLLLLPCRYHGGSDASNGIDRIDSERGYEIDNCGPCCAVCNRAKSDMSVEEFLAWVRTVANHNN